jgi:type II secretory pathway pseudopilin PulG
MDIQTGSQHIIDEKQGFGISSLVALFAFSLALAFILSPMVRGSEERNREKAILQAQALAYQAAAIEFKKGSLLTLSDSEIPRNPASEAGPEAVSGVLGNDPWGQAFHYRIRQEGKENVVDIWSAGEHGIKTQVLIPSDSH